jgi:16S rRNA (guanine966-N2)-methyltransferase
MVGPRIIAGAWRGRVLAAPPGMLTRPTHIRARQAVFDILAHAAFAGAGFLEAARVLDVFAGTGAFGLEALSRGARAATFIENDRTALAALAVNIAGCKAADRAHLVAADVLHPPRGAPHDLVFLDPPYASGLLLGALAALAQAGYFTPHSLFIAELGPGDAFAPAQVLTERRHGKARLVFWRNDPADREEDG